MKSRSHRLPPSDPPDDWGDGSWTVDCSCGVTFDDGEEMVSCDECGVWVHTRCSRFVKGEASFACHNCRSSAKKSSFAVADNTEETEVAQLLIELPTKTDPCPPLIPPLAGPPHRPPFRLWAEIPLEDRVHVQGVPGGDPSLFQGLSSSVFTSELWKCAGYVPKKFNFQYREFSCWDEEGGENPASRGADVLFSLSKEIVHCGPVGAFERKHEGEKVLFSGSQSMSWGKKERNKLRVSGSHSSKRRKEELGEGKDRSGKKKSRSDADRVATDIKKRGSLLVADMNKADFCEDGGLQVAEPDIPDVKSEERKKDVLSELNSTNHLEGMENGSKPKHVLVIKASKGCLADETQSQNSPLEMPVKVENDDGTTWISSKIDGSATSHEEGSAVAKESIKGEDVSKAVHGLKQPKDESHFEGDLNEGSCRVVIDSENSRTAIDNLSVLDALSVPDTHKLPDSNGAISLSTKLYKIDAEIEGGDVQAAENTKLLSCPDTDGNSHGVNHLPSRRQRSTGLSCEIFQEHETVTSLPSIEHKSRDTVKEEVVTYQDYNKTTEGMKTGVIEPKQQWQVVEESAGSSTAQGSSFEPRDGFKNVDEPTKFEDPNLSHVTPNVHKLVVGVGKASSTSPAPVISRPSVSSSYKPLGIITSSKFGKAIHLTKQQRVKVTTSSTGKDNATTVSSAEERMQEVSRHPLESHTKGSDYPGSKSSQTSRISHASKYASSDSKEQLLGPSSKASTAEKTTILSGSDEAIGLSQNQNASVQIKQMPPGSCQKNEINQPILQPPSKLPNHLMSMHPPESATATTTLSDEELALLLHQELNSSPRVPRVPRVRQATGMQLASPTTLSMLSKRSSYSGGKDQVSVFRRKNKEEASRDSSRNSHEVTDGNKRVGRVSSSPDHKYREPTFMTGGSAKKNARNRSPDAVVSGKKNLSGGSTEGDNSTPPSFEASGQNPLSVRSSPRDFPDDDTTLTPRTLPVLIDEIMSKGKCSTYEELCIAVHPHWHNLRKPNGERYAYSSHSHAVLDCLRNRSEWAHLIDRGPKTNSSRRRRKLDSDTPAIEESEHEEAKNKASSREVEDKNGESYRDDFPKGKRKARKRRRLELQGRGMKEARKRRGSGSSQGGVIVSDDDEDDDPTSAFSHSSNDGADGDFSEDESQEAGLRAVGTEVSISTSSDDSD